MARPLAARFCNFESEPFTASTEAKYCTVSCVTRRRPSRAGWARNSTPPDASAAAKTARAIAENPDGSRPKASTCPMSVVSSTAEKTRIGADSRSSASSPASQARSCSVRQMPSSPRSQASETSSAAVNALHAESGRVWQCRSIITGLRYRGSFMP
ncbi:hypothetical protein [Candidatus Amarobacter glycogenicus]|uniref:hypothetical protein n=1 Tax=Candidatus Amarobacter glycogenicus TaxID=3140699 RepID=UPI002A0CD376|nr:hypothetical protein [Dehalococcoidia bacterium]